MTDIAMQSSVIVPFMFSMVSVRAYWLTSVASHLSKEEGQSHRGESNYLCYVTLWC